MGDGEGKGGMDRRKAIDEDDDAKLFHCSSFFSITFEQTSQLYYFYGCCA